MDNDDSTTHETSLAIEGMDCASCVAHVEKAIRGVRGVTACRVNLARGRAVVEYHAASTDPAALAAAVTRAGYAAAPEEIGAGAARLEHERLERQRRLAKSWLRRAVVGLVLWLPVELSHWILHTASGRQMPGWMLVWSMAAGTLAIIFVGAGFYRGAWAGLRAGTTNMDTLIAMGSSVAFLYSLVALIGWKFGRWSHLPDLYFTESAGLLTLISVGHWLEARAREKAGSAIRGLMDMAPALAIVRNEAGQFTEIPVSRIRRADLVLVRPGDRIAVDGVVVEGESDVDESLLTGESMPVAKRSGDKVSAGTSNQSGRLLVKAKRIGSETSLAQIIRLVETAQSAKPPVQRLADQIAAVFVPAVLFIALITATGWYAWGMAHGWSGERTWGMLARAACSVLIIACPCALGLAVPTALMVGLGRGARRGILIRDIDALQHAERLRIVALDKTGTLTEGKPAVVQVTPAPGVDESVLLCLAAAAERFSEHPLGKAIVREAERRGIDIPEPGSFNSVAGMGVFATVEGRPVLAGSAGFLRKQGVEIVQHCGASTSVYVAADGVSLGCIELADPLRPDSIAAVASLHVMGLRTVLLTGDRGSVAERIAREVGIGQIFAEVAPREKAEIIRDLARQGQVAMAGDGVNDAPALAVADLGIAMGGGSDIARETGGIVLVSRSLTGIPAAIRLSRATMRKIRQNLFLAFAYNVLAIPLAALGMLNPLIAAGAMALSDVTVIGNALLLKRTRIDS